MTLQRNFVDMLVQDLGYDSVSLPTLLVEGALSFQQSAADRALHFTVIEVSSHTTSIYYSYMTANTAKP
jgi:hypothetical protein